MSDDKLSRERWDYLARIGQVINVAQGGGFVVRADIQADTARPGVFIHTAEENVLHEPNRAAILIRLDPAQARRYAYAILNQLAESEATNDAALIGCGR